MHIRLNTVLVSELITLTALDFLLLATVRRVASSIIYRSFAYFCTLCWFSAFERVVVSLTAAASLLQLAVAASRAEKVLKKRSLSCSFWLDLVDLSVVSLPVEHLSPSSSGLCCRLHLLPTVPEARRPHFFLQISLPCIPGWPSFSAALRFPVVPVGDLITSSYVQTSSVVAASLAFCQFSPQIP